MEQKSTTPERSAIKEILKFIFFEPYIRILASLLYFPFRVLWRILRSLGRAIVTGIVIARLSILTKFYQAQAQKNKSSSSDRGEGL